MDYEKMNANFNRHYEEWIYSECGNDEDAVFELLKFNHEPYLSEVVLDVPEKAYKGKIVSCKLQNNCDLSLKYKIGYSSGDINLNYTANTNFRKLQNVSRDTASLAVRSKTLETLNHNPFRSLRANILRLQGYAGRKKPLSKLKPLLHFLNSTAVQDNSLISESIRSAVEKTAAEIIQDFWNRYVFRVVFQHLRQLLWHYSRVDPASVLRPINPTEAMLLDAASGSYLRFRLGGASFPPVVLYKIFTNRPVIGVHLNDVSINKILRCKSDNSSIRGKMKPQSKIGNVNKNNNDWRPFMDPSLHVIQAAEFSYGQVKKCTYPRRPPKSKEEQIIRRKKEKIDSMKRLYRLGKQEESLHDSASESSETSEDQMIMRNYTSSNSSDVDLEGKFKDKFDSLKFNTYKNW